MKSGLNNLEPLSLGGRRMGSPRGLASTGRENVGNGDEGESGRREEQA